MSNETDTPWTGYRTFPERLNIAEEVLNSPLNRGLRNRVALVHSAGATTYESLRQQVNAVAARLISLGLAKSDLVLIKMSNCTEFALAFLALVKVGAIPVLVNSLLSASELRNVVEQAQPRWVFTTEGSAAAVRDLLKDGFFEHVLCAGNVGPGEISFDSLLKDLGRTVATADTAADEPAFIVYTSGTTGKPKGIVHAHRWIVALGDLNRYRLPPKENDVVMATGEWSFISALGHNLLFPLRNGVTGAILAGRAKTENILQHIAQYRVTVLHSVATVYRRLLAIPAFEKQHDLTSLRCAHSTGEALREATYDEWK